MTPETHGPVVLGALHRSADDLAAELRVSPREMADGGLERLAGILLQAEPWAGSIERAYQWFLGQPLPSFGKTAADLFRDRRADAVKAYLDRVGVGGFA